MKKMPWFFGLIVLGLSVISRACDAEYLLLGDIHLKPELKVRMPFAPSKKGSDIDSQSYQRLLVKIGDFNDQNLLDGVITVGDHVGHNTNKADRKNISLQIYQDLANLKRPIFYGFGNNDAPSGNYQAYFSKHQSPYFWLNDLFPALRSGFVYTSEIKDCKKENLQSTCLKNQNKKLGNYSVYLKPKLKLIQMNSVPLNGDYPFNNQSHANRILDWLDKELNQSDKAKDSVLLAMHIPPGINLYSGKYHFRDKIFHNPIYQQKFSQLLKKHLAKDLNIIAILAGHTHYDETHIFHYQTHNIPTFVIPALSTSHGNASAFKKICLTKEDHQWQIKKISSYSITSENEGPEKYLTFPDDICFKQATKQCLKVLYDFPQKLLALNQNFYYANNLNQQMILNATANQLIDE